MTIVPKTVGPVEKVHFEALGFGFYAVDWAFVGVASAKSADFEQGGRGATKAGIPRLCTRVPRCWQHFGESIYGCPDSHQPAA
jgi:hypothetical protein